MPWNRIEVHPYSRAANINPDIHKVRMHSCSHLGMDANTSRGMALDNIVDYKTRRTGFLPFPIEIVDALQHQVE